jgi:hypothetical protein
MKLIGITGGSSLCELGPASDVQLFFDCLNTFVVSKHPEKDWSLLVDRLYKRYLRLDELDSAVVLMEQARKSFVNQSSEAVDWKLSIKMAPGTRLDSTKKTLVEIFENFFDHFIHCVESAKTNYEGFKSYQGYKFEPVRIVVSDQPWFIVEKNRPLEEYDTLIDKPFWLC